jgi:hypothetical protein
MFLTRPYEINFQIPGGFVESPNGSIFQVCWTLSEKDRAWRLCGPFGVRISLEWVKTVLARVG